MINLQILKPLHQYRMLVILLLGLAIAAPVSYSKILTNSSNVEVEIINDHGQSFDVYPLQNRNPQREFRTYVEAIKGENYALRIRNLSNKRIGLVIAVDGRNIISGEKSYLNNKESMYILKPYETQTYAGWRTSESDIHRFYFTDVEDSYAHAFNDRSAMGVIAIAVFEEKPKRKRFKLFSHSNTPAPSTRSNEAEKIEDKAAGTGFGDHKASYTYRVQFEPKYTAKTKFFFKYEWRETLCQKQVIPCSNIHKHEQPNRFWPHEFNAIGFVPYPPNYK